MLRKKEKREEKEEGKSFYERNLHSLNKMFGARSTRKYDQLGASNLKPPAADSGDINLDQQAADDDHHVPKSKWCCRS